MIMLRDKIVMTPYWLIVALQGHKGRAGVLGEPGSIGKTVSGTVCTRALKHPYMYTPYSLARSPTIQDQQRRGLALMKPPEAHDWH